MKLDRELRTGAALVNGQETVMGTILMLLGENSRTVAIDVDAQIQEVKKNLQIFNPTCVNTKIFFESKRRNF